MLIYTNLSNATYTFHGVTFEPRSTHSVPHPINHPNFFRQLQSDMDSPTAKYASPDFIVIEYVTDGDY